MVKNGESDVKTKCSLPVVRCSLLKSEFGKPRSVSGDLDGLFNTFREKFGLFTSKS